MKNELNKLQIYEQSYLKMIRYTKYHSAIVIHKYLKGYKTFQLLKDSLHKLVIDRMVNHFSYLKEGLYIDS